MVALSATAATLLERAERRSRHPDTWLPGDDLFGRDHTYVREVVREAAAFRAQDADLVIETDGRTPADIAALIAPLWSAQ